MRSTGKYDIDDHNEIIKLITSLDLYRSGAPVLHEMQHVDFGEHLRELDPVPRREDLRAQEEISINKFAQVVMSDNAATALEEIGLRTQRPGQIKEVFRSLKDALEWLEVSDTSHRVPPNIVQEFARMLESDSRMARQPKIILGKERDRPR